MLAGAAELISQRQKSKKTPRTYADYREMLKEKDLDIVLIGTPDHWHSLPMIAAVEAGADVYVQKPISRDVIEGEAMVAAARKHGRVVQVGTQRRSTPHWSTPRRTSSRPACWARSGMRTSAATTTCGTTAIRRCSPVPDFLDYEMWTGPAPLRPYDGLPHRRWWRAFMEYGNGIVGDMCVHMFDATRWMLGLGWPKRVSSSGGIFVEKEGKSNISDTQTAIVRLSGLEHHLAAPHLGRAARSEISLGDVLYGDKGTLKASVISYDFIPRAAASRSIKTASTSASNIPRT